MPLPPREASGDESLTCFTPMVLAPIYSGHFFCPKKETGIQPPYPREKNGQVKQLRNKMRVYYIVCVGRSDSMIPARYPSIFFCAVSS